MKQLLKTALVGTGRQTSLTWDAGDDIDSLTHNLQGEKEDQLLLAAGAYSLYEQAGQQALTGIVPITAAPSPAAVLKSPRLIYLLDQVLGAERSELLGEFLLTLAQRKLHLPHEVLPQALDMTDAAVRKQLLPVLGERGRWLSQFQSKWAWVSQGITAMTEQDRAALRRAREEGKLAQRALALSVIRQTEAAEGRRWFEETLPQEKADARAQLLEQFEAGLSLEDEPLLERLLDDRSEQVKQIAAALLRQMPAAALSQRMQIRANAMLTLEKNQLRATPPEELTADWLRDGISARVPTGRGKRAFWVESLLGAVPVTHWSTHFKLEPLKLLHAVQGDDYAHDIVQGWTRAIQLYGDHTAATLSWAHALWNYWIAYWQQDKKKSHDTLNRMMVLLKLLPPTTAEQQLLPFLVLGRLHTDALIMLLGVLHRPWSPGFATQYLKLARQITQAGVVDEAYEWAKTLEIAGRAIPREVFSMALVPWELTRQKAQSWTAKALEQLVERFTNLVQLRNLFLEELAHV